MVAFIDPTQRIITFHEPWKVHFQKCPAILKTQIVATTLYFALYLRIQRCCLGRFTAARTAFGCHRLQLHHDHLLVVLELSFEIGEHGFQS
ncbi:hypothetical protein ACFXTN_005918 [Malus domestica]